MNMHIFVSLFFVAFAAMSVSAAEGCGGFKSAWPTFRETFLPGNRAQLLFPRCPFCWAARVFVACAIGVWFIK
jgi:hypothetical protein